MAYAVILLALVIAIVVVVRLLSDITGAVGILGHHATPLSRRDRAILERTSSRYSELPGEQRPEFAKRVKHFLYDKEWIGEGIAVTREMQVHIAATATQITLGFEPLLLMHFERIVVYPDVYTEERTGQRMLGGTDPMRKTIALSWKHFLEGAADRDDGRHVGLHELAHALWLENRIPNAEDGFFDKDTMSSWRILAEQEAPLIRKDKDHFFRSYAATNQAEFFAVALENFFERPVEYRERLPDLYVCMVGLLKQDPAEMR